MSVLERPLLDPERVTITKHALGRYSERRNTTCAERGIRRLIDKAASRPCPPLTVDEHGPQRRVVVGGYVLIFDAHLSTLITLWRAGR